MLLAAIGAGVSIEAVTALGGLASAAAGTVRGTFSGWVAYGPAGPAQIVINFYPLAQWSAMNAGGCDSLAINGGCFFPRPAASVRVGSSGFAASLAPGRNLAVDPESGCWLGTVTVHSGVNSALHLRCGGPLLITSGGIIPPPASS